MTPTQFLKAKNDLLAEQANFTEYTNAKFAVVAQEYLKANCPFEIGQTVDVGERKLTIQHIEPLTWFELVMIRLYGVYENGEVEQNGVALTDKITLSCPDKQTV